MRVLTKSGLHPVLVDVGASGDPPAIWKAIAKQSTYVGFDPDLREMKEGEGEFYKQIIVNEAITSDASLSSVCFYLTKSPFCSSTLEPDTEALANYHFHDLFTVERTATAPAATLGSVLKRVSLDRIDWLKLDTQGTDLRIFTSLPDGIRSRVLALDVEPGLIDAYKGEDLFVDTHAALLKEGFWLADANIGTAVRVRESSLKMVTPNKSLQYSYAGRALKKSPAYCEARYFRTLEWMVRGGRDRSEYILLWSFAMVDGQLGFAMDVALEYHKLFGEDEPGIMMRQESLARLRARSKVVVPLIKMKRLLKRMIGRNY
ncbi:MAG TPA: FkbM family methyltransferase [Terriglobia bacterium]|nr:FkbM family methyltransferase [Terriglobia bacterium]